MAPVGRRPSHSALSRVRPFSRSGPEGDAEPPADRTLPRARSFETSSSWASGLLKDALLVIDVINNFDHEDGNDLLEALRRQLLAMAEVLAHARTHAGSCDLRQRRA